MARTAEEKKAMKKLAAVTKRVVSLDHELWENCRNEDNYRAYIAGADGKECVFGSASTALEAVDIAIKFLKEQEAKA